MAGKRLTGVKGNSTGPAGNDAGVSETTGVILLLATVMIGVTIVLTLGMQTIGSAKTDATYNGAEQAFTVADSKLSKARFSTSIYQEAPFELRDGTVAVNDSWDNSHIIVYDIDNTRELYNGTLGTIKCKAGDREVAYQDGGVWVLYPNNHSLMISPPDFDYNGVTLTLPVMSIQGKETMAASGNARVLINVTSGEPRLIYPKEGFGGNPIPAGNAINLTIKSDYYEAWAAYINERTRAEAKVDAPNKTVNVSLNSGMPLQTRMAADGFTTKSMDTSYDAPIQEFRFNLIPSNSGNDPTITYGIPSPDGSGNADPQLTIEFSPYKGKTNGNLEGNNKQNYTITFQYKHGTNVETFKCLIDFQRKSDSSIDVDMLSREVLMTHQEDTYTTSWGKLDNVQDDCISDPKNEYDDITYKDVGLNGDKTLHDVTEHYMTLMAKYDQQHQNEYEGPVYSIDFEGNGNGNGNGGNGNGGSGHAIESGSQLRLAYMSSEDIKYLYITEGNLTTMLKR